VTPPAARRAAAEAARGDDAAAQPGSAEYKVVEVSPVGEDTLEQALNDWTGRGFSFESLHFVSRDGSHRPALAYLFFVRSGRAARGAT
jgi:hypothetical protein